MRKAGVILLVVFCVLSFQTAQAQLIGQAHVGLKFFGIKGATTVTSGGTVSQAGNFDGGKTVFNIAVGGGYTVVPAGVYNLDVLLDINFATAGFAEQGYNSAFGSGKFSADGLSGATTTILAFDIMPAHRLNVYAIPFLSPWAGVGLSFNMYSTSDLKSGPPSATATLKGNTDFKVGLIIFYGAAYKITDMLQPFLQFKHHIPFSSEMKLTDDPNGTYIIKDAPGYFNIEAGMRVTL